VFRGKRRIAGRTEKEVYASVDLPWIPPELRENNGEIEAARQKALPKLVQREDLRGDLHCHTRASDGHNSIREMAEAAHAAGLEYLAITDHTQHLRVAHGLDSTRLLKQMEEIDALNEKLKGITLLKGAEVDILDDGGLDLPDDLLARLDVVIAAVHSNFNLPRAKQTRRILRALDNPRVHILAHPSGRLIGEREPMDLDIPRILRHARKVGVVMELNASPDRLDLTDVYCRVARDEGVRVAINSDAHSVDQFANLRFGIDQARRGWLESDDVVNTGRLKKLRAALKR
jgi:DNA polymerase (family X)